MALNNKLSVGIVGGGFGTYGLIPAFRLEDRCEITSICTLTLEKSKKISIENNIKNYYTSFEEMIENNSLDIIAIATIPSIQEKIIKYAAEKKIHIFCEKPAAVNYTNAFSLYEIIKKNNVKSCIDFPFLEIDEFIKMKQKISSGELGIINECNISWKFCAHHIKHNIVSWKNKKNEGGGLLPMYASHTLSYIEFFFGEISKFLIKKYNDTELSINFITEGKLLINFDLKIDSKDQQHHSISVEGSKETVILETSNALRFSEFYFRRKGEKFRVISSNNTDQRYLIVSKLIKKFINNILYNESIINHSFEKGVRNQFLIQKIDDCLNSHEWNRVN